MKQENTFGPYLEPGKLFIYGDSPRALGGFWSDWIDRNWQLGSDVVWNHSPFYNELITPLDKTVSRLTVTDLRPVYIFPAEIFDKGLEERSLK